VDRNTITIGTCDVNLSFGAHPAEIPGIVRFLHPLHNFALVAYSPAALPAEARSKICAAQVSLELNYCNSSSSSSTLL
jgi:hypothetical protein